MSERPFLSIIIPMYNEEEGIPRLLSHLSATLVAKCPEMTYEVIIVDDGSSDGSVAAVHAAADPTVYLCQHPENIGNGAAIKTGMRRAQGEYILMMDADGQHKPEDIPRLLEHIDRFDMVVGARTKESDSAKHRDLANFIYNSFASYVCGRKIEDLTSGFRVIRASLAKQMIYLLPNTFSYPTTITLAVVRSGYSLKYVPIIAPKRIGKSKIKIVRDGSRFLMILFKIATLFSPLKIFVPASLVVFFLGFFYGLFKVVFLGSRYGPTSALLMTMGGL
ncbi:MAG: glycosyltransferase family 2 protein, partial [Anaerolineae bacterium]|nr:glycosyltransferase family 2 protein [Anaerolineae bacterium]